MGKLIKLRAAVHPAAELFPLLDEEQLQPLVESMQLHGYDRTKPVLRYAGKILDGRNRMQAAELAGVTPVFVDIDEDRDPFLESWKHNGARRDLLPAQRGSIYLLVLRGSEAWQVAQGAKKVGTNNARSEKAKAQHAASKPRAGEKYGAASREARPNPENKTATEIAHQSGVSRATIERVTMVSGNSEAKLRALATGKVQLADAVREHKRTSIKAKLESVDARAAKELEGVFDVVVIDPPWPMEKIERDERPNQTEFDYPTMSEGELAALDLHCADDCHVWLWSTQKFLPMAFRLLGAWGLKYVCTFVWHKPGGFQPIGLPQYNCEFALYARMGTPSFLDTKAFPTCFKAQRGAHSEKPEGFYDVVRRVTAGRRLDMFNRRKIKGFTGWGKEAAE